MNEENLRENVKITTEIDDLIRELHDNKYEIYDCIDKIDVLRTRNARLEQIIYNNCQHIWERDCDESGPYSSTEFVCKICKLYK